SGSTLTLSATLDGPWTAGATLVPLLQTYLDGQSGSRRVGAAYGGGSWSFRADLTQCALPAGTEIYDPGAYLGLDVMTGFWGADSGPEPWTRRAAVVEADAGRRVYDSQDAAGGLTRTLAMPGRTSAEALAVRRFLAARLGRLRPFWLPTYDHDLTLAGAAGSGASSIDVYDTGYSDLLWPSRARRHLAIRCPSGATVYREIAEPEDQGAGVSRLNFVSGTLPEALPAGTGVSFLRHCRLADDLTEFAWSHVEYCDVTLRAQELPVDCPAGVTS
ncbi:MAG: hypothetical protein Q8R97_12605, partial [Brevundimonas sp.]|nr:hypothetical protein [Brevundimonas sp.]